MLIVSMFLGNGVEAARMIYGMCFRKIRSPVSLKGSDSITSENGLREKHIL